MPLASCDYQDSSLEISKGQVPGHSVIHKFGHNEVLSTNLETIWSGSNIYVYPVGATLMNLTSTDVDDVVGGSGAWNVTVLGLDSAYGLINETVQLNGQTPVSTTQQYLRIYRMYVRQSGATMTNEGIIYLGTGATAAGVPTNIYAMIDALYGQTFMTQFTIPDGYTGYMKHFEISCYTANKQFVVYWQQRPYGESWRHMEEFHMDSAEYVSKLYDPPRSIQARTDIEFIGKVDVASGLAEAGYTLILVEEGYEETITPRGDIVLYLIIMLIGIAVLLGIRRRR